jgi:hypothetical protein
MGYGGLISEGDICGGACLEVWLVQETTIKLPPIFRTFCFHSYLFSKSLFLIIYPNKY